MPLQDSQCKNAVTPAKGVTKLFDGGGLFLQVDSKGRKYWRLQYYRPSDKKKDVVAIGVYPDVSLKEARLKQAEIKLQLADGIDPKQQQKVIEQEALMTFEIVARQWHSNRKDGDTRWTPKHAEKMIARLENHVFPIIGGKQLSTIKPLEILALAKKVEETGKTYTAHKVLEVVRQVFTYGITIQACEYNPASDLSGELKSHVPQNFPSITDEEKLKELLQKLESYGGTPSVRALLRLSPYVFTRPSEVRLMKWAELDLNTGIWTKEAKDMKNRLAHIVPLSRQAKALLEELKPFSGHHEYVFWNNASGKPVSDGACRQALNRMGYKGEFTPHGWRHTASTLLHEQGFNTMWIEAQLSHKDTNKVRGTYNKAAYIKDRRTMMQASADYLDGLKTSV